MKKRKIVDRFNGREKEIMKLLCQELTSAEIGKKLDLSEKTISNHIIDILKKTRSKNRIGIVIFAINNRIYKLNFSNKK